MLRAIVRSRYFTLWLLSLMYLTTPVSAEFTRAAGGWLGSELSVAPQFEDEAVPDTRGCTEPCRFCACAGYRSFVAPHHLAVLEPTPPRAINLNAAPTLRVNAGYVLGIFRPPTA